jgi:hypothetical protein
VRVKQIEGGAKERVAQGLHDEKLEREAHELKMSGEREMEEQRNQKKS